MNLFRNLSRACLAATFALVAIGGYVRATKSGLGCGTDWPRCSGKLIPSLEQRAVLIEYSHRLAAGIVVILITTLAAIAVIRFRSSRKIMWPAVGAFLLVWSQAVIGAVVVKLELEAESVVLHLGTALGIVAMLAYLVAASSAAGKHPGESDRSLSRQLGRAAAAVFLLMLVGSYVSGRDAGLVFPDWPLMDGRVIPDLSVEAAAIHFFHRALAALVGVVVFVTGVAVVKRKSEFPLASRLAHIAMGLFAFEVAIGALNVWTDLNAEVVTAHLFVGSLIWGSLVGAAVVVHPVLETVGERNHETRTASRVLEARS